VKYYDEYLCLFVCLSVRSHNKNCTAELHEMFLHVACGRGSVLLKRHCDMLCTSGFTDEVMFPTMRPMGRIEHDVMIRRVRQVAISDGYQTTAVFG